MTIIRNANDNDISKIEYICRMTAGPGSRADEVLGNKIAKTYSTYYARAEQDTCFVLEVDENVVGYILCAPNCRRFSKGFRKVEVRELFKISKIYAIQSWLIPLPYKIFSHSYPAHLHIDLLDDYTNSGNGSKMMNVLLKKLRDMNIKGVMLIVGSNNTSARRFYTKNGFHKILSFFDETIMGMKL